MSRYLIGISGALRLAERVELAFFKMNVMNVAIGFVVLGFVSAGVFLG